MAARLSALALCALAISGASAQALRPPAAPKCPVFPASSPWNLRVDRLPVAADSDAIVRSIGVGDHVHADFGSGLWEGGPIRVPITVVGRKMPRTRVSFEYAFESDKGPYPIPRGVRIEGGPNADGDRHAILVDKDRCRSSLASPATTRSSAGASTTRSASRSRARAAPTSTQPATSRATSPTRPCRRWVYGCG